MWHVKIFDQDDCADTILKFLQIRVIKLTGQF